MEDGRLARPAGRGRLVLVPQFRVRSLDANLGRETFAPLRLLLVFLDLLLPIPTRFRRFRFPEAHNDESYREVSHFSRVLREMRPIHVSSRWHSIRFRREGIRGFGPSPTFANPGQTWGALRLKMSSRLGTMLQTRKCEPPVQVPEPRRP